MARFRIVAVLLTPSGNYDETTSPKGVKDFNALDKAWEEQDIDTMHEILTDYGILDGAIEEHDSNDDWSIQADADGYYLLKNIDK